MAEETTNSGTVEAPAETEAPTLQEGVEATSSAPPIVDEYQQRVEALLKHHEQNEKHQKQINEKEQEEKVRSYENISLEEGESFDAIYDAQTPEVQRLLGSLRGDYTRKMQALSKQRRELEDLQATLTTSDAFKALQVAAQEAAASGEGAMSLAAGRPTGPSIGALSRAPGQNIFIRDTQDTDLYKGFSKGIVPNFKMF